MVVFHWDIKARTDLDGSAVDVHVVLLLQTQQRAALFKGAATAVLLFYVPATRLSLSAATAFAAAAGYVCLVRASVQTCLMSRGSASVAMSVLQYAERHRGV